MTNRIIHSMGQPLQSLRNEVSKILKTLYEADKNKEIDIESLKFTIDLCFDFIHDAKTKLGFFAELGTSMTQHHFEQGDIKSIILDCCRLMNSRTLEKKGRFITNRVKQINPISIEIQWLRMAILNLIDNACKYSWNEEKIEVRADEDDEKNIIIQVINRGVGIPTEGRDRVFEPYFRFNVPDEKGERSGTGSGLPIVKHAIEEIHGGHINVESEPITSGRHIKRSSAEGIKNVQHKTIFTILLNREKLHNLSLKDNGYERNQSSVQSGVDS